MKTSEKWEHIIGWTALLVMLYLAPIPFFCVATLWLLAVGLVFAFLHFGKK